MARAQPTLILTDRFGNALAYPSPLHRDQQRKGSGSPYVSHLLALENDADDGQGGLAQRAVIHARFGDAVAQVVADCTDSDAEL